MVKNVNQSRVEGLLIQLEKANKHVEKRPRNNESRKIRKELRALGHRGGLRGC